MKKERQNAILRVISTVDVDTQNQLIEELQKLGISSTQATLSRDIKELNLVKRQSNLGVYKYSVSNSPDSSTYRGRLKTIFKESVISCDSAQNLVIIKTLPGLAPAACGAIDSMGITAIVGSIAGDDTGFLAMKDSASAENFCSEIAGMLK